MIQNLKWAFFGSSQFGVMTLENLKENGFLPELIITIEDKPKGRKMIIADEKVKVWAKKEMIPFLQLKTLRNEESFNEIQKHFENGANFFLVANYGKMIPKNILDFPQKGVLNIHPSLLPKLRGPSPIKSSILSENETGVTIIKLDQEMDHGPIISQKKTEISDWPPYEEALEKILAGEGVNLFIKSIQQLLSGEIKETDQDHKLATYCKKIEKADAKLNLNDSPEINLRKIRAFHRWPGAFYFEKNGNKEIRVIVKSARIINEKLIIEKVIPEGKKEMPYEDFKRGIKN